MTFRIQVLVAQGTPKEQWCYVRPSETPEPYEFDTEADAEHVARLCYDADSSVVRIVEVE